MVRWHKENAETVARGLPVEQQSTPIASGTFHSAKKNNSSNTALLLVIIIHSFRGYGWYCVLASSA